MKNLLTLFLLLIAGVIYAQEAKNVKNGYITFNSGTTLYFKDLTIQDGKVKYLTETAVAQTEVSLSGVKKIVDNTGAVVYTTEKAAVTQQPKPVVTQRPKQEDEKLVYKSYNRLYLGDHRLVKDEDETLFKADSGVYNLYRSGRRQANWGDYLIGGGLGFTTGFALGRLAGSGNLNGAGPFMAVGVVAAIIGIPIKISGTRKVKEAVNQYNNLEVKEVTSFDRAEMKVVAGAGTVGLQIRF